MKHSTLNTLMVAKAIYGETKSLVNVGNKHASTAGIILLQDFIELVVLAALDELDVDETRNLESKSFDELLGELKKFKVPIVKSGTIKALNKQRVIAKHYGQLTEPTSVINYFNVARRFVDELLSHVVGCGLQEIFLTDMLKDGKAKDLIRESISCAESKKYLDALVNLRKAFYSEYEFEYCIYQFRNIGSGQKGFLGLLGLDLTGVKAHYWKKNSEWISENVKSPSNYLQVNHEQLKTDCIEWGLNTVDVENFRRLTPTVVETEKDSWHVEYEPHFAANELNQENFSYCLDVLLSFLIKKQEIESNRKWPKRELSISPPPIYIGNPIYKMPSRDSEVLGHVEENFYYSVEKIVSGFDPTERYLYVHLTPQDSESLFEGHIWGYLLNDAS
ncbi:hypothetical protein [Marinobacter excellens]|uniref:Uncharacterized protein n=1 Tax=Marinobacter excellens LAMA 842 TaxID=1306954 RepID=A0A137SBD6_9GAMM|nr:hypothetical protein [Marinobacter excellens]KXO09746.1 hypothetical protein J122_2018 [Marinobacter excellens LAMA 842]